MISNLLMQQASEVKIADSTATEESGGDASLFSQIMGEVEEKAEGPTEKTQDDTQSLPQQTDDAPNIEQLTESNIESIRAEKSEQNSESGESWDTGIQELINKFTSPSASESKLAEHTESLNDEVLVDDADSDMPLVHLDIPELKQSPGDKLLVEAPGSDTDISEDSHDIPQLTASKQHDADIVESMLIKQEQQAPVSSLTDEVSEESDGDEPLPGTSDSEVLTAVDTEDSEIAKKLAADGNVEDEATPEDSRALSRTEKNPEFSVVELKAEPVAGSQEQLPPVDGSEQTEAVSANGPTVAVKEAQQAASADKQSDGHGVNKLARESNPLSSQPVSSSVGSDVDSDGKDASAKGNDKQQTDKSALNPMQTSAKDVALQNPADVEADASNDDSSDSMPNLQQLTRNPNPASEQSMQQSTQAVDSMKPTQEVSTIQQQARAVTTAEQSQDARQQVQQKLEMQQEKIAPALGQRLMMMVNNKLQTAEIKLDPPELGSMMVRVQVQNDQAHLQITTQQPQTREMLEQAMPRLRDMLQEHGLQLADAHVGSQGQKDSGGVAENEAGNSGNGMETAAEDGEHIEESQIDSDYLDVKQGIDYYA